MPSIVHLAGDDGLLEAASRVRAAPDTDETVLAVPEGAPVLANPLFLRTLRALRPASRFVLVTADARGRALASGIRMAAYASVAAYEQKSVDPTERLEKARLAALAEIGRERARRRDRSRRAVAFGAAALVLLLAVGPSAEVVVAADETAMAPVELQVVAGPNAPVNAARLQAQLTASVNGAATDARIAKTAAAGVETFTNASTDNLTIPVGFIVTTSANVQFRTTQARPLPASRFFPLLFSEVQIPIEAVEPGTAGNVGRDTIKRVGNGDARLRVTNPEPTSGGDEKRIPRVQQSDLAAASVALDQVIDAKAQEQIRAWEAGAPAGQRVERIYATRTLSRTATSDLLGKEVDAFPLSATVEITTFSVPDGEPQATAMRRLGEALQAEHELVPASVIVDVAGTTVTSENVTWRVSAHASERPRLDESTLQIALAGQERASAAPLLAQKGIKLVALHAFPSWWPRLPFLPLRIDVRSGEGGASGP